MIRAGSNRIRSAAITVHRGMASALLGLSAGAVCLLGCSLLVAESTIWGNVSVSQNNSSKRTGDVYTANRPDLHFYPIGRKVVPLADQCRVGYTLRLYKYQLLRLADVSIYVSGSGDSLRTTPASEPSFAATCSLSPAIRVRQSSRVTIPTTSPSLVIGIRRAVAFSISRRTFGNSIS